LVNVMAKEYTCGICNETFMGDRESVLVEEVQSHAQVEHETELEEQEIREGIVDT